MHPTIQTALSQAPTFAYKNWRYLMLPAAQFHAEMCKERWKADRFARADARALKKLRKRKRIRVSYEEARQIARAVWPGARTARDYFGFHSDSRGAMTALLPMRPDKAYGQAGWTSWSDFLL